jgi:hypothetical protein
MHLPTITAKTWPGGVGVTIPGESKSSGTLLYAFSPTCVWCYRNELNLAAVQRCAEPRYRFIALAVGAAETEAIEKYFDGRAPDYEIVVDAEGRVRSALRIDATPMTVVITPAGRVSRVWRG